MAVTAAGGLCVLAARDVERGPGRPNWAEPVADWGDGWVTNDAADGFVCAWPGSPRDDRQFAEMAAQVAPGTCRVYDGADFACMAAVLDLPAGVERGRTTGQLLDDMVAAGVRSGGGRLIDSRDVVVWGGPGRLVTVALPGDVSAVARVVLTGRRVVAQIVGYKGRADPPADDPRAKRFFDSFRLVN